MKNYLIIIKIIFSSFFITCSNNTFDLISTNNEVTGEETTPEPTNSCGDYVVDYDLGEVCDEGGVDTVSCDFDCTYATCGDGYVNYNAINKANTYVLKNSNYEECDPGNLDYYPGYTGQVTQDTDFCDKDCTEVICGDGHINNAAGEECEYSKHCSNGNSCVSNVDCFGNGDGFCTFRLVEGDGCSATCQTIICGNGILQTSNAEQCDDGNTIDTDSCNNSCQIVPLATCSNGAKDAGEECDPSVNGAYPNNAADCNANCTLSSCGDGYTNTNTEDCDTGGIDTLTCNADCTFTICGDSKMNAASGETCDDGNTTPDDGCDANCYTEICGNGVEQPDRGEECDDGGKCDNNIFLYCTKDADCGAGTCVKQPNDGCSTSCLWGDENEPNNTWDTANQLTIGGLSQRNSLGLGYRGAADPADGNNIDWFEINITQAGMYEIQIDNGFGAETFENFNMILYKDDGAGGIVSFLTGELPGDNPAPDKSGKKVIQIYQITQPGLYYLKVSGDTVYNFSDYYIKLLNPAPENFTTGAAFSQDSIANQGDIIWYSFDATTGQEYIISWEDKYEYNSNRDIDLTAPTADIVVSVYDSTFQYLYADTVDFGYIKSQKFLALNTEKIYVRVHEFMPTNTGNYYLKIEPGIAWADVPSLASNLNVVPNYYDHELVDMDQIGWFKITVDPGMTYYFSWNDKYNSDNTQEADLEVTLYDANMNIINDKNGNPVFFQDHGFIEGRIFTTSPTDTVIYARVNSYHLDSMASVVRAYLGTYQLMALKWPPDGVTFFTDLGSLTPPMPGIIFDPDGTPYYKKTFVQFDGIENVVHWLKFNSSNGSLFKVMTKDNVTVGIPTGDPDGSKYADVIFSVYDATGNALLKMYDNRYPTTEDYFQMTPPVAGDYYIRVETKEAKAGSYYIKVLENIF
ncbi:MAG: DUF4215 domain-containing protein [Spirochaetia bacterium]|nr:DUF4215 domain-containing protein [Spirochaetia bacterium]